MPSTTALRLLPATMLSLGVAACATAELDRETEAATEARGRVIERSLVAVVPGRLARDPGLSLSQRSLSASQDRSAMPFAAYEHKVAVATDRLIVATSESSAFIEGTCVRILVYPAPRPARIAGAVPCQQ